MTDQMHTIDEITAKRAEREERKASRNDFTASLPGDSATPYFTTKELAIMLVMARTAFGNGLIDITKSGGVDFNHLRALDILGMLIAKLESATDDAVNGKGQLFKSPF